MQSKNITKLLESEDKTNVELALKILVEQVTKANCIAVAYQIKSIQSKFYDDEAIPELVKDVMAKINEITGFKINRSISKSSKHIYKFLIENHDETNEDSVNAFLKYYMEFVKYSITLDTSFDYIPPENLNLFTND